MATQSESSRCESIVEKRPSRQLQVAELGSSQEVQENSSHAQPEHRARQKWKNVFEKIKASNTEPTTYEELQQANGPVRDRWKILANIISQQKLSAALLSPNSSIRVEHPGPERSLKMRLWELLNNPQSSKAAFCVSIIVILAILATSISLVLETEPSLEDIPVWNIIDITIVALFTIEFSLRLISAPSQGQFWRDWLNYVDLLAILPFYVILATNDFSGGTSFRALRLVRVFRIFKLSRYFAYLQIFSHVITDTWQPMVTLLVITAIAVVFFSSLIYFVERGSWDESTRAYTDSDGASSPFQSIPDTFYWTVITFTTVGYGDVIPRTVLGRVLSALPMLFGTFLLAIPMSVISAKLTSEYSKYLQQRAVTRKYARTVWGKISRLEGLDSSRKRKQTYRNHTPNQILPMVYTAMTAEKMPIPENKDMFEGALLREIKRWGRTSVQETIDQRVEDNVDALCDEVFDNLLTNLAHDLKGLAPATRSSYYSLVRLKMDGELDPSDLEEIDQGDATTVAF